MARPRARLAVPVPWLVDGGIPPTRDAQSRPLLRLQTLGASVVQCGELRIGPSAGVLFAILVRLTYAPGMQVARDELVHLVWGGPDSARRRASLRQALYKLRSVGVRVVLEGGMVRLDAAQVARTFASDRSATHFERDVTRGHEPFGPFLPGYAAPTAAFDEWMETERESIHAEIRRVLVEQLRARRERADWTGAEALARWLLQFDPLHEDATLTLAECTMLAGAKLEAIAILDRYLAEIGPGAGDVRLPAAQLRRRFVEATRGTLSFAPTERHFVGREQELADLTLAMRRARWRDGSAVLFHGASGIGKSRFAHEVTKVATIEGVRALHACCRESDGMRTLALFHDMLPELLSIPGALGCTPESMATLQRLVGPPPRRSVGQSIAPASGETARGEPAEPAIGDAVAVDADEGRNASVGAASEAELPPVAGEHDGGESVTPREPLPMAGSIRRAFVDLMAAISDERPVLLVIDDAHWMDLASWDVLADIIDRISALRLVVLVMSREPHARPTRPERVPTTLRVRPMPPLSAESGAQLTRLIGNDLSAPVSDSLCAWFVEASEGSPLFLRSLVQHWIETGEAGGVPPTLVEVIEQRLTKLSPEALRVLQTAALLGEEASVESTQHALDFSTANILDSLDELARAGMLRASELDRLVAQELTGKAALRRLTEASRRLLSLRVAESIQTRANLCALGDGGRLAAAVVRNFLGAGLHERATTTAVDLAETFLRSGLPAEALLVCECGEGFVRSGVSGARLRRLEMEALYQCGCHSRLLTVASASQTAFSVTSKWDSHYPLDVLRYIESSSTSGRITDYGDLCARAVLIAESEIIPPDIRLRASITAIRVASHGIDSALPERAYRAATNVAERTANQFDAQVTAALYYHTAFGRPEAAIDAAECIVERIAPTLPGPEKIALLADVAYAFRVLGRTDDALRLFEHVLADAKSDRIWRTAGVAAWYLSLMALDSDAEIALAKQWIEQCEELAVSTQDELLLHIAAQQSARIATLEGDINRALSRNSASKWLFVQASHPKRVASELALDLFIAITTRNQRSIVELLPSAANSLANLSGALGQDFLATQVIRGSLAAGKPEEARRVCGSYLARRREQSRHPGYLMSAVSAAAAS